MTKSKIGMDAFNLWNDDPVELLLELGFGCDEPDLTDRIPARFINYQSQARGINLQVFLESEKNRIDLENPDVSNRFRQLEVLQQVTSTFCSLVVSSSSSSSSSSPSSHRPPVEKPLSPKAQERRRRMGALLRRASKKSLSQIHNQKNLDLTLSTDTSTHSATPELLLSPPSPGDKNVPSQSVTSGLLETVCTSPLAEELGTGPNSELKPPTDLLTEQEETFRPGCLGEVQPLTENACLQRKRSSGQAGELIDVQQALTGQTGSNTGSQRSEVPGPPFPPPPRISSSRLLSPSLLTSDADRSLPSSSCPLPGPSEHDMPCSETEKPKDEVQSPASLTEVAIKCVPPRCSSPELPNIFHSQSPAPPSPDMCISHSRPSSDMSAASLTRGSEDTEAEGKDAPHSHLSLFPHDYTDMSKACPAFSSDPPFLSASPNLDCPFPVSTAVSSTQSDSTGGLEIAQLERTEVFHQETSLSVSDSVSPFPSPTYARPTAPLDFHSSSSFPSSQITESFSKSPENKSKDFVFSDSGGSGLSIEPANLCSHLDNVRPSAPSHPPLDSSKVKDICSTLHCPTSIPICPSTVSTTQFRPDPDLTDLANGGILELTEQSISKQCKSCSHNDNTDLIPPTINKDVICAKKDQLSSKCEDSGKQVDRQIDNVQSGETVVCISDSGSPADLSEGLRLLASGEESNQTETIPQVCFHRLNKGLSAEAKQEDSGDVCQRKTKGPKCELNRSYFVLNQLPESHSRSDVKPKDLAESDLSFETSVDGVEDENGDMDAFFQQLDNEGRVYWAEPVQVFNPTHVLQVSDNYDASDGPIGKDLGALDSISSTLSTMGTDQTSRKTVSSSGTTSSLTPALQPKTTEHKLPSRSVSVQMSSSLSSHIVHRRDVPYVANTKHAPLYSFFSLDTSDPLRAVQAWTDMQIWRNINKLSHQAPNPVPNESTVPVGASEKTQQCGLPRMARNYRTVSGSVDTGLGPEKEEELYRNGNEDKENLWEGHQSVPMTCCCSCDHQCQYKKQHSMENTPYSLGDLEEMMLCLQHFRCVQSNMEEQVSEDRASVYSALSDQDREKIQDLEMLRRAVKQEAGELQMHLNELAHHYDDNMKMKMHRLLDEQSLLCSQLRVYLPGAAPTSSNPPPVGQ